MDVAAVDLDAVDEPQLDEVQPELRVDDVRQRVLDVLKRRHGLECSPATRIGSPSIIEFSEQPAVLRCSGDEDIATRGRRRTALSRALASKSDVVVDLTELTFADSSLILDLAIVARRLRRTGRVMRLRDPQPQVLRVIEVVGLNRLPGVAVEESADVDDSPPVLA
ncbi:MAG TPA: STAS domain-containing protein [Solirubrobacteraceae bacterium]|nr:STAS domain-containing protein [Solirubrobacteraceae bacterium]